MQHTGKYPSQTVILPLVLLAGALTLPFWARNEYLLHVGTLICVYWILISGLNLVIGYMGQLSVGHVGLLALGAYCYAILQARFGVSPELALLAAAVLGGLGGFLMGIPSLRLPGFYFAMSTLAFSIIVIEIATARKDITGGGAGLPVPPLSGSLGAGSGFYWVVCAMAVFVTGVCWSLARGRWGRSLIAIRDSEVTATSVGINVAQIKLTIFAFSGILAGVSGALFGALQGYITTESFHLDLGMFFFICVVIGGSGSIVGPLLGTLVLTALPETVTSFAAVSGLVYGVLMLVIVLAVPGGLSQAGRFLVTRLRPPRPGSSDVVPKLDVLASAIRGVRRHD